MGISGQENERGDDHSRMNAREIAVQRILKSGHEGAC